MDIYKVIDTLLASQPTLALLLIFILICIQGPTVLTLWFLSKTNATVVDKIVKAIDDLKETVHELGDKFNHLIYRIENIERHHNGPQYK